MGSRIMHLLLADAVAEHLGRDQRGRILMGALAPDASANKRAAHFKAGKHLYADNPPIQYGQFVAKYRDRMGDPYFIGYLTHLVMDDVWTMKTDFSGFEKRIQSEPGLYEAYHEDLHLCNAKLLNFYRPIELAEAIADQTDGPDLDEVPFSSVVAYRAEALADFAFPQSHLTEPLRLFSFEEMVHYVERSKSQALDILQIIAPHPCR